MVAAASSQQLQQPAVAASGSRGLVEWRSHAASPPPFLCASSQNLVVRKERHVFPIARVISAGWTIWLIRPRPLMLEAASAPRRARRLPDCWKCGALFSASPELKAVAETPRDLWSLGVLIFGMLSGLSAFDRGHFRETKKAIKSGSVPMESLSCGVSSEAMHLICSLLHRAPAERPTARELLLFDKFVLIGAPRVPLLQVN